MSKSEYQSIEFFEGANYGYSMVNRHGIDPLFEPAHRFDDQIYANLAKEMELPSQLYDCHIVSHQERCTRVYRGPWLDPWDLNMGAEYGVMLKLQRETLPSANVATGLLRNASATLTSLCFDWVLTMPQYELHAQHPAANSTFVGIFFDLFDLRFPHLRALQFRNAVVPQTSMPEGLYLLDHAHLKIGDRAAQLALLPDERYRPRLEFACLAFMEAHSNLQCLAWPMDSFFSEKPLQPDIADRVRVVIDNLGRTLVDLRIDTIYSRGGELLTEDIECRNPSARERRRRFISDFAAKMTKVESIKIEGGMPRDERRETVRALHACPLKKIVMIGVCSPAGNCWGPGVREWTDGLLDGELEPLEFEDMDAIYTFGSRKPEPLPNSFKFEPTYGWPAVPSMVHTIASSHADTVKELKFCGYKGAPVLFNPCPITSPMLSALKSFDGLESLIISMWLPTQFEGAHRDREIIRYWLDTRSPASTSLVRITDEEPDGWEKELRTKYAPDALAWHITSFIGPFLSEKAKARNDGLHVRVSMCIGDCGGIFDIDLHIGKGSLNSDICLNYKGPREELEPDRRKSKLESRRWF